MTSLARFIKAIDQAKEVFPPLKRLLFEAFWFTFVLIEMIRLLWWLAVTGL